MSPSHVPVSHSSVAEGFGASQGHAASCTGARFSDSDLQAVQVDPKKVLVAAEYVCHVV